MEFIEVWGSLQLTNEPVSSLCIINYVTVTLVSHFCIADFCFLQANKHSHTCSIIYSI